MQSLKYAKTRQEVEHTDEHSSTLTQAIDIMRSRVISQQDDVLMRSMRSWSEFKQARRRSSFYDPQSVSII